MNSRLVHSYLVEAFSQIGRTQESPEIEVVFYPYAGLNNTIRVRKKRVYVRISDVLIDAPSPVLRAIAFILVAKLYRKRVPKSLGSIVPKLHHFNRYRAFSRTDTPSQGRKVLSGSLGKVYDLESAFVRLNRLYFQNALKQPTLSWSQRRTFRIFGHHDPVHNAIIVSRTLDARDVPGYVVDYIMYHEMLHLVHRPKIMNGRWYYHTPEFKADERKFTFYAEASKWFEELRVVRVSTNTQIKGE